MIKRYFEVFNFVFPRPHLEEIPNDENQGHRVRMEEESWKKLGFDLEGQPLFIGGIPKHLLTKQMRKVKCEDCIKRCG